MDVQSFSGYSEPFIRKCWNQVKTAKDEIEEGRIEIEKQSDYQYQVRTGAKRRHMTYT
jgi:hypothetical protein